MSIRTVEIMLATDADGACTAYSPQPIHGKVHQVNYLKVDFADGSTMTLTDEAHGTAIWSEASVNASATRCPRQATHSTAGAAALYAAGGAAVNDYIWVDGRLKVVVSSGGATKTGKLFVTVEELRG